MIQADRETAERHREIWEEFRRQPIASPWAGQAPLPPEVTATAGFVIPVDDEAVRHRLQEVVARLEATGAVNAFPPDYWHITIVPPALLTSGKAAPPRLLPASMAEEALEKGRKAVQGQRPFKVAIRGLNAFRDVLVAIPYDGGRGTELGRLLRSAMPELPERYPTGHDLLPHISLVQYTRDDRLEAVMELIQRERRTDFGHFRAQRLEMYVLPEHEGAPGLPEKHPIPLQP